MIRCLELGLAAAIGWIASWLWLTRPSLLDVKVLDVMTAFGTCGAVALSLWLARRESDQRLAVQAFQAGVLRKLVRPELEMLRKRLHAVARAYCQVLEIKGPKFFAESQAALRVASNLLSIPICQSERVNFASLPQGEAEVLGELIGRLTLLKLSCEEYAAIDEDVLATRIVFSADDPSTFLRDIADGLAQLLGPDLNANRMLYGWLSDITNAMQTRTRNDLGKAHPESC